jgi:hypothetical protein
MAGVIDEFLVSIGYKLDDSSVRRGDEAIARSGVAAGKLNQQFKDLGTQLKSLGETFVSLAGTPTAKVDESSERIRRAHQRLAVGVKELGLVAFATTTAFVTGFREIAKQYEALYYISQRTGTSAENLAALRFGAGQIGVSADNMTGLVNSMASAIRMSPGLGTMLENLTGDVHHLATGTGSVTDRTQEFLKFLDVMADKVPFYRDQIGQLYGIPPDLMEQLVANRAVLRKSVEEQIALDDREGINRTKMLQDSAIWTRDLGNVTAGVGRIMDQAWAEAYPGLDKIARLLGGTDGSGGLLGMLGEFNKIHPFAAMTEEITVLAVSISGLLGLLGLVPGLGVAAAAAPVTAGVGLGIGAGALSAYLATNDPIVNTPESGFNSVPDFIRRMLGMPSTAQQRRGFAEGGIVPINAHAGEMVLPRAISEGLQSLFGGGGFGNVFGSLLEGFRAWWSGSQTYAPYVRILPDVTNVFGTAGGANLGGAAASTGGGSYTPGGAQTAPSGRSAQTGGTVNPGAMTPNRSAWDAQSTISDPRIAAAASIIAWRESKDRDVNNFMYRVWGQNKEGVDVGYTASGFYQMLTTNWHKYGAGLVDFAKYPHAQGAPRGLQDQVFARMFSKEGYRPWSAAAGGSISGDAAFNAEMRSRLGTQATIPNRHLGVGGGVTNNTSGDKHVTLNAPVHITGDPDSAMRRLADAHRYHAALLYRNTNNDLA